MCGAIIDQQVMTELLRLKLPKLAAHFQACSFDPTMLTLQWFTCLFAYNFNAAILMRIWDVFIIKGPKMLFRIALAIFHLLQSDLLKQWDP